MKDVINILLAPAIAILLALCLTLASCSSAKNSSDNSTVNAATQTQNRTQSPPTLQKQRQEAEQEARPDVEKERKQAEDEASKTLGQEAKAAIDETQKAIDAIAANKNEQALAVIEQATGKINILLARNPATALIPSALRSKSLTRRHTIARPLWRLRKMHRRRWMTRTTQLRACCSTL